MSESSTIWNHSMRLYVWLWNCNAALLTSGNYSRREQYEEIERDCIGTYKSRSVLSSNAACWQPCRRTGIYAWKDIITVPTYVHIGKKGQCPVQQCSGGNLFDAEKVAVQSYQTFTVPTFPNTRLPASVSSRNGILKFLES